MHVNGPNHDSAVLARARNFTHDYHMMIRTEIIVRGCYRGPSLNTPESLNMSIYLQATLAGFEMNQPSIFKIH